VPGQPTGTGVYSGPVRIFWKVVRWAGAAIVAVLTFVALAVWWTNPKRAVDGAFVRPAGAGVFTFADIPRGRALSPEEVDGYARRLLAEMSLEEKVLQMSGDSWTWDLLSERWIGRAWSAGADRRLRLPPIVCTDGPRGVGIGSSTCFPTPMARAASWDRSLEARVADAAAREARGQGANLWLAPCLNVLRHPRWGRAQESYGEDPYLVAEMGVAAVAGAQRNNVMACAKHYALNSIEHTRMEVDVRADERTLREVYLPQFRRVVDAGVAAVMSAYNRVDGDYCAENRRLLRDILKDEWGFRGFVVSDFFTGVHDGVKAARAGLDLEMPMTRVFGRSLRAAVEAGQVPETAVDEAVVRLLRRRIDYATRPERMAYGPRLVRAPEHVALAREAAEKGVVLLRNDGLLPLDRGRIRTLAVVGALADAANIGDHGSSRVRPPHVVTPLEGLSAALGPSVRIVHEAGADLPRVRQAAKDADAVVVVAGFTFSDEGEYIQVPALGEWGGDRATLGLKPADRDLILAAAAENPRTAVVLMGGAAITVEDWKDRVGAILMAFYPGERGGEALARVLLGDVNPSGKLPFTVPADASQLPPFDNQSPKVEYGYYHGYTLADAKGFTPAFPFGYGLSYTTYRYANLSLEETEIGEDGEIRASVDVTNTGRRAGEEVAQLYVGFAGSKVDRPVKLLRGFEKVALAPGETKRVGFVVKAKDLAYYDPDARRWVIEEMDYEVLVGPSSRAADLVAARVRVKRSRGAAALEGRAGDLQRLLEPDLQRREVGPVGRQVLLGASVGVDRHRRNHLEERLFRAGPAELEAVR